MLQLNLTVPLLALFVEGVLTIACRGGHDYKFISPSIAMYLGKTSDMKGYRVWNPYEFGLNIHLNISRLCRSSNMGIGIAYS